MLIPYRVQIWFYEEFKKRDKELVKKIGETFSPENNYIVTYESMILPELIEKHKESIESRMISRHKEYRHLLPSSDSWFTGCDIEYEEAEQKIYKQEMKKNPKPQKQETTIISGYYMLDEKLDPVFHIYNKMKYLLEGKQFRVKILNMHIDVIAFDKSEVNCV